MATFVLVPWGVAWRVVLAARREATHPEWP